MKLDEPDVCNTDQCWFDGTYYVIIRVGSESYNLIFIELDKNIKSSLDETVSPCDNFYQFACGGWIAKTKLPETERQWDTMQMLQTKVNRKVISLLQEPIVNDSKKLKSLQAAKDFFNTCTDTGELFFLVRKQHWTKEKRHTIQNFKERPFFL